MVEQYTESFRAQGYYGIFDLIVEFDQCVLDPWSQDLITFLLLAPFV